MTSPTLELADFDAWFAAVNDGNAPYAWQRELTAAVLEAGRWPDALVAPTGSGKSSVIEIHVFVSAVRAGQAGAAAPPRRLCHVVGRRALVDDAAARADRIRYLLRAGLNEDRGVVTRVARRLAELAPGDDPLGVWTLRGGITPERGWQDDATSCQIICATPDMFGSRLLFRGYGSTVGMRPREAGLLAYDTVAVLDEAHLNRQLLMTVRRVAELAGESPLASSVPALQVVETTATSAETEERNEVGVAVQDVQDGSVGDALARRLTRPKPITVHTDGMWLNAGTAKQRAATVERLADLVQEQLEAGARPVGVVLNRVANAVDVWAALRRRTEELGADGAVQLMVGPRRRWEQHRESGFGDPLVYVATQTIEVGVDLDFGALITEAATGAALAQRAGRLNRSGARDEAPLHLVVPSDLDRAAQEQFLPYEKDDVVAGLEWAGRLAAEPLGLAPVSVMQSPPPHESPRRLAFSELESARADLFSMTSERLVVEPDLTFWLRDSLDADQDVTVVGRHLPREGVAGDAADLIDVDAALALLTHSSPQWHEAYPTGLSAVRRWLRGRRIDRDTRVFFQRGDGWQAVAPAEAARLLRAGDLLCVDHRLHASRGAVFDPDGDEPVGDVLAPRSADGAMFDLPEQAGGRRSVTLCAGDVADVPGMSAETAESVLEICAEAVESADPEDPVTALEVYDGLVARGQETALLSLLGLPAETDADLLRAVPVAVAASSHHGRGRAAWAAFTLATPATADDAVLSTVTESEQVLLADHQHDVGDRAEVFANRIGLPEDLVRSLRTAGLHHDDGKADNRFQQWLRQALRAAGFGEPLAKSGVRWLAKRQRSYLPGGWRHEQYSVVRALTADPELGDLTLRLIGTSHGHGRGMFDMGADELLPRDAEDAERRTAHELFDVGRWESLIDATNDTWGPWGCAYLEALLRSADVTISKEGR